MREFFLRVRRGERPFYLAVKQTIVWLLRFHLPIPRLLLPLFRIGYLLHWGTGRGLRRMYMLLYAEPLFRGRCDNMGNDVLVWSLPDVVGHTRISIGDHVSIWGKIGVCSGRVFDEPRLLIGNHVDIGHQVQFTVNKEIVLEEGVMIANHCYISDTDSHPRDPAARVAGEPPAPQDIKPVRICRNAWIGVGSTICKGVTIGEGAIIGTRSVVMADIPAHSIALGNPARVRFNIEKFHQQEVRTK